MLNTPEDVLYPQITNSVYETPVFRRVVIVDIRHRQGCLASMAKHPVVSGISVQCDQDICSFMSLCMPFSTMYEYLRP